MTADKFVQHGTLVNINGKGLLLLGNSGAGKSDLALRLIMPTSNFMEETTQSILVADDQIEIFTERDGGGLTLYGQAPTALKGLLEVRHLGIKTVPYMKISEIHCALELKKYSELERLPPENTTLEILKGVSVPLFYLDPFEASVLNKLNLILNEI